MESWGRIGQEVKWGEIWVGGEEIVILLRRAEPSQRGRKLIIRAAIGEAEGVEDKRGDQIEG